MHGTPPVSYTHLDVYKRQVQGRAAARHHPDPGPGGLSGDRDGEHQAVHSKSGGRGHSVKGERADTVAALRFPALLGPPIAPLVHTVGPSRSAGAAAPADRGPSSKSARCLCHWQRFADFLETASLFPPLAALRLFPLRRSGGRCPPPLNPLTSLRTGERRPRRLGRGIFATYTPRRK